MLPLGIQAITAETDVYTIGSISKIKAVYDKGNPVVPYHVNVFHQQRGQILEFLDPAAALSRVNVIQRDYGRLIGKRVEAEELTHDSLVIYKFLGQEYSKLRRIETQNQTF